MENNRKTKQQSFMHASLILIIATALVKVIGAIYRIPLANLLGETGMGFYSTAYDLYLPMYSLAMAGLPVAISRIISEHIAAGRYNDVAVTLKVARRTFWVTGSAGFLIMCLLSVPFVNYVGNTGALAAIFCIAPCLLICCIMSAYRGYYEGLRNMMPTAISQVLEALGKLVLGYGIAFAIIKIRGDESAQTLSLAAAGALLGITLGTIVATAYLVFKYKKDTHIFTAEELKSAPEAASGRDTLRSLIAIAVPIVLGSLATYVTSLVDVVMVQRQIAKAVADSPEIFGEMYKDFIAFKQSQSGDFSLVDLPNALYGAHRGYAYSIYNLVPVITSVLGVSAIPVLATAWTKKDTDQTKANIETIFRTTALVALPAGLGIFALSGPILSLLYSENEFAVAIATPNLRVLGIAAIFAGLTIPMTSMLQAIGKQNIPVRNIAIGAVIKVVVNFLLVSVPEINIKGVPYGTACCYVFIFVANYIAIRKYSGVKINVVSVLIKPTIAASICAVAAFAVCFFGGTSKLITLAAVAAAVVAYVVAIALLRAVCREDILSLPKGDKIAVILEKLKIIDKQ